MFTSPLLQPQALGTQSRQASVSRVGSPGGSLPPLENDPKFLRFRRAEVFGGGRVRVCDAVSTSGVCGVQWEPQSRAARWVSRRLGVTAHSCLSEQLLLAGVSAADTAATSEA